MTEPSHDRINLTRLVRRLEKSVAEDTWSDDDWLKTQGTLQKVKYAKKLLRNVEMSEYPNQTKHIESIRSSLSNIESFVLTIEKRTTKPAEPTRPPPLLPTLPLPTTTSSVPDPDSPSSPAPELSHSSPTENLLLSPDDASPALPPPPETNTTPPTTQTQAPSNTLHAELSNQLLQMSTQLKRNAVHFSSSLAAENPILTSAQETLEANYGSMSKSRVKLRDYSQKSGWGGTTGLVGISLLVVVVSFVVMFFVIRVT